MGAMSPKPGRNDPCPCGSGKKYKKCCGRQEGPSLDSFRLPDDRKTGTPLDDYLELLPLLGLYEQKIVQFDADGPEYKKVRNAFEKRYRPGAAGGLMDSHSLTWLYLDRRFGRTRRTLVERVLDDPQTAALNEPGPTLLRHMAESYATFYQVVESGPDVILLEELGTGKIWTVHYIRELFGDFPGKGEIWYTRLLGPPERALSYTTPYIYDPETRAQFKRGVDGHTESFLKSPQSIGVPADRLFAESQKQSAHFWFEYIHVGNNPSAERPSPVPAPGAWPEDPEGPIHFVNTDKEELLFTETYFRVEDEPAVRQRLDKLKTFRYDERDASWIWRKAPRRVFPDAPQTTLGRVRFKDGCLVAETNSRERAVRLEYKLLNHLDGLIVLDKTLYKRLEDLPRPSPEEAQARRKETEELNARPEVQEAMRAYLEHHYFEELPLAKVPALGNITPVQAAKTETGRRKLADLIDYYDRMQALDKSGRPKIDFDRLRLKFGLPAKSR